MEIFQQFTIEEIITLLVFLCSSIYGLITALSTLTQKATNYINGKVRDKQEEIEQSLLPSKIDEIERVLSILLESDKCRIRGEIVKQHDYHMREGYIDLYNLDYLQKQANCYFEEGGNSYIHDLMEDLSNLPHDGQNIVIQQA